MIAFPRSFRVKRIRVRMKTLRATFQQGRTSSISRTVFFFFLFIFYFRPVSTSGEFQCSTQCVYLFCEYTSTTILLIFSKYFAENTSRRILATLRLRYYRFRMLCSLFVSTVYNTRRSLSETGKIFVRMNLLIYCCSIGYEFEFKRENYSQRIKTCILCITYYMYYNIYCILYVL